MAVRITRAGPSACVRFGHCKERNRLGPRIHVVSTFCLNKLVCAIFDAGGMANGSYSKLRGLSAVNLKSPWRHDSKLGAALRDNCIPLIDLLPLLPR